jgi:hypothetical protein
MRFALLALVMLLASCSTDGGSSGTGITSVEGNVAAVHGDGAAAASTASTAGIDVTVDGTSAGASTDAAGRFVVRGKFEGRATLHFQRAADAVDARMTIVVPRGGTLTLDDVQVDVATAEATADRRHAVFDAQVTNADCAAGTLALVSVGGGEGAYVYALDLASSFVHDADGTAVACGDLRAGERVHVEATARMDGTFGDGDVTVER